MNELRIHSVKRYQSVLESMAHLLDLYPSQSYSNVLESIFNLLVREIDDSNNNVLIEEEDKKNVILESEVSNFEFVESCT